MGFDNLPPTLVKLCAVVVSRNMDILEHQAWDLPGSLIEQLLPFLNIFYLERIENAAVRKGISTTAAWFALWMEVIRNRPVGCTSDRDWKQKFLESAFHIALSGNSKMEHERTKDPRFCILTLGAKYVKQLTFNNRLQGAVKLAMNKFSHVLQILKETVLNIKFQRLRQNPDKNAVISLTYVLHSLIHHGNVQRLIISDCRIPSCSILTRILQICAGYLSVEVQDDLNCFVSNFQMRGVEDKMGGSTTSPSPTVRENELACPLSLEQDTSTCMAQSYKCNTLHLNRNICFDNKRKRTWKDVKCHKECKQPCLETKQTIVISVQEDLHTSLESCKNLKENIKCTTCKDLFTHTQSISHTSSYLRCISALDLDLSNYSDCLKIQSLLPSWVGLHSLEVFSSWHINKPELLKFLEALSCLCQSTESFLRVLSLSGIACPISLTALLIQLLKLCPRLESVSVGFSVEQDQEEECSMLPPAIVENSLTSLKVTFPLETLHLQSLLSVLRGSGNLQRLHLTGMRFKTTQDAGALLLSLADSNPELCWLTLEDVNLSVCQNEVLHFLKHTDLKGVNFTECRIFERNKAEFLSNFVAVVKQKKSLVTLQVPGNRLGNQGLVLLADLFTGDSVSGIIQLDISSNFILSDGLLQFGKMLQKSPPQSHLKLDLRHNPLDRDIETSKQAMELLTRLCSVVMNSWNSQAAFADYISAM
ncbi:leucine-rich repeat-containing protein 41 [Erpetoichthys calabaricus]|uniref:Leucine-rich repeat-containing protein 41 n=1 Tax=Erpetoichthys calabaricus TaxID=27687 RepID=A0A8C4XG65_ERPCA|nr:leucine-rich repeat-containing protein 41 [Erpetoichthys calabaricus]